MPKDFLFPPVPDLNAYVLLDEDIQFERRMLGALVDLSGFDLELTGADEDDYGLLVVKGEGTISGDISRTVSSGSACLLLLSGGTFHNLGGLVSDEVLNVIEQNAASVVGLLDVAAWMTGSYASASFEVTSLSADYYMGIAQDGVMVEAVNYIDRYDDFSDLESKAAAIAYDINNEDNTEIQVLITASSNGTTVTLTAKEIGSNGNNLAFFYDNIGLTSFTGGVDKVLSNEGINALIADDPSATRTAANLDVVLRSEADGPPTNAFAGVAPFGTFEEMEYSLNENFAGQIVDLVTDSEIAYFELTTAEIAAAEAATGLSNSTGDNEAALLAYIFNNGKWAGLSLPAELQGATFTAEGTTLTCTLADVGVGVSGRYSLDLDSGNWVDTIEGGMDPVAESPAGEFVGQRLRYGDSSPYVWYDYDGDNWVRSGSGLEIVSLTTAEYSALTDEERDDPTKWYVLTDA